MTIKSPVSFCSWFPLAKLGLIGEVGNKRVEGYKDVYTSTQTVQDR